LKIEDPFQISDWGIKKTLSIVISLQLALWGLVELDNLGFHIPILRQLIAFIYLTIIPGILILRIFNVHKLGSTTTLLYSIGLSISAIMLTGFSLNVICPFLGIDDPLSLNILLLTFGIVIIFLSLLSYIYDRSSHEPNFLDLKDVISPFAMVFLFLPFLSIFSTYYLNYYDSNWLQMALLFIIALSPIFIIKWLPEKYYPIAIFSVSLSLLYHTSLISNYIWGSDINAEYYFSQLVFENFKWDPTMPGNVNAMLSVTILPAIYSTILDMDLIWVFKIIFPFLFSFVPLGLFVAYKSQTNAKTAFLASVFLMFQFVFYTTMMALARQQLAEFFLVIFMISMINIQSKKFFLTVSLILFGFSLTVSHYGLTYIMMFVLILAWLLTILRINGTDDSSSSVVDSRYIVLFIIFTLSWFMYISNFSIFESGLRIISSFSGSLTDIFAANPSQAAVIITEQKGFLQSIEKIMHLICIIFISVGVILSLYYKKFVNYNHEYYLLSLSFFFILIATALLPVLSYTLNSDRIYHIGLFFLAPFFVIGFSESLLSLRRLHFPINERKITLMISIFLAIFFLFNSAFVYQIFDQEKFGRFALDKDIDFPRLNEGELAGIDWWKNSRGENAVIYSDTNKVYLLIGKLGNSAKIMSGGEYNSNISLIGKYVFLGTFNIINKKLFINQYPKGLRYTDGLSFKFRTEKLFDNGMSCILRGTK
jgi:uncharacterized membrane protein